jgi:hypothetical protein
MIPITALARLLWNEQKAGFAATAWTFFRFIGRNSLTALHTDGIIEEFPNVGKIIRTQLQLNQEFLQAMTTLYCEVHTPGATPEAMQQALDTDEKVELLVGVHLKSGCINSMA